MTASEGVQRWEPSDEMLMFGWRAGKAPFKFDGPCQEGYVRYTYHAAQLAERDAQLADKDKYINRLKRTFIHVLSRAETADAALARVAELPGKWERAADTLHKRTQNDYSLGKQEGFEFCADRLRAAIKGFE